MILVSNQPNEPLTVDTNQNVDRSKDNAAHDVMPQTESDRNASHCECGLDHSSESRCKSSNDLQSDGEIGKRIQGNKTFVQ